MLQLQSRPQRGELQGKTDSGVDTRFRDHCYTLHWALRWTSPYLFDQRVVFARVLSGEACQSMCSMTACGWIDVIHSYSCTMQLLTLWGWTNTSWVATIVLMPLVPCLMLLEMHQPHLHQHWRLHR